MKTGLGGFLLIMSCIAAQAQSSGEIYKKLQRLNQFQKVLYVAAHPDDENTRVISWLSRDRNAYVAYLSLTRGDGGQNMIGTELGAELGVLRTQELLAARRIDGGEQFFTRAVDFGYSKTPEETLNKWNKRRVLSDVVRVIRHFQPDLIITRFPADRRGGHGHHTASAILALEAFDLAASDTAFADQLEALEPWQARAIYWNSYSWRWNPNLDSLVANDPDYVVADVGEFDPALGVSYNELASVARSQHKSQGFGMAVSRGSSGEYFQRLKGKQVRNDILEVANRNWVSIGGTPEMEQISRELLQEFDFLNPAASVERLIALRKAVSDLKHEHWRTVKLGEIDRILAESLGIYAEAVSTRHTAPSESQLPVHIRVIARLSDAVSLTHVAWPRGGMSFKTPVRLPVNEFVDFETTVQLPGEISQSYWLREPFESVFAVSDPADIVLPENPPATVITLFMNHGSERFELRIPVDYKWSDRVEGELRRPVSVAPRATATFSDDVVLFTTRVPREVRLLVRSFEENFSTAVSLKLPEGWKSQPRTVDIRFEKVQEEKVVSFQVTPPETQSEVVVQPVLRSVTEPVQAYKEISYPHIAPQVVYGNSGIRMAKVDLEYKPGKIGYIQGAGDEVDQAIEQMGFEVARLNESSLAQNGNLGEYRAIVIGIRAYNVHAWLLNYHDKLMQYVENGGNLIVQYNTATRDLLTDKLGPYPFTIGRDRVTDEQAEATLLEPAHPFFNTPNAISNRDFDNWVQERGLYFASEWDERYRALISWKDEGDEEESNGALLYAPYGQGSFTYVGISFFRQLPAGVPGAYRLMANILSHD